MQKKNKACVISHGEDYWLVRQARYSPRCDKIGYVLINQILFGVTPKNQKRSKRGDTEELGYRVKM